MEACFLSSFPLAFWDEEGVRKDIAVIVLVFLRDILEETANVSYQFEKKIHPESTCDVQGEMHLNFMPYDSPCDEEQARKDTLSTVVFTGKVFRLDVSFFYFPPILRQEQPQKMKGFTIGEGNGG